MGGLQRLRPHQLKIFLSNKYAYAQIFKHAGEEHAVVAHASSIEKGLQEGLASTSDKLACAKVGQTLGERAQSAGVTTVHWTRKKGQKFHGKTAALLTSLQQAGVKLE